MSCGGYTSHPQTRAYSQYKYSALTHTSHQPGGDANRHLDAPSRQHHHRHPGGVRSTSTGSPPNDVGVGMPHGNISNNPHAQVGVVLPHLGSESTAGRCGQHHHLDSSSRCQLLTGDLLQGTEGGASHINTSTCDPATTPGTHHHHNGADAAEAMAASPGTRPEPEAASSGSRRTRTAAFHCHLRRPRLNKTALYQLSAVSVLCVLFMIGEIIGGAIANSLALITDATHLASDLTGFLVSLFSIWIGSKPPSARMSFGYYRAEVLGALISVLLIWGTTGVLVYLAVQRIIHQDFNIDADSMLATAGAGVAFNIVMGLVLNMSDRCGAVAHAHGGHGHSHGGHQGHSHRGHQRHTTQGHSHLPSHHIYSPTQGGDHPPTHTPKVENNNQRHVPTSPDDVQLSDVSSDEDVTSYDETHRTKPKKDVNINVRAAFIHIIGDFIQSIGVFIAALIIKFKPEYNLADPICTFIFSVLVLITTITILRETLSVILEAVPRGLDYRMCKFDIETLEGVRSAHSLNVWALTTGKNIVSVHLAVGPHTDRRVLLEQSVLLLREKYNAFHVTVQMEEYDAEIMTSCEECLGPKLC